MNDATYMAEAIEYAKHGLFSTTPNPRVGCLIVKNGEVIGRGAHIRAGEGHAEVHALAEAGTQAEGATAYVTLEPCAHYGRTPPCAEALIKAKVKRVVIGMSDPFPQVAGKGIQLLKDSGIEVVSDTAVAEAEALNPGFLKRVRTGLPYVRCKMAASLDGATAMNNGDSKWITGPEARQDVQRLRAQSCVVLTGIDTLMADDAKLTVRPEQLYDERVVTQPKRAVIDSQLKIPMEASFLAQPDQTIVFTLNETDEKAQQLKALGVQVIALPNSRGQRVDIEKVLQWLGQQDFNEILLESGSRLAGAFAEANLIDEYIVYYAPILMGTDTRPLLDINIENFTDRKHLKVKGVQMVGQDIRVRLMRD